MRGFAEDRALQDAMSSVESQPQAEEIGEQQDPGEGQMREVHEEGEDGSEDGEV